MTDKEALQLNKGDIVLSKGKKYKVVYSKEVRHNKPCIIVKIQRGNNLCWTYPEYIDRV